MRRRSQLAGGLVLTATAIALALFLVAAGSGAEAAAAQAACDDDFGQFEVSTAAEFNFAIDCFNSATFADDFANVQIVLLNDIEVDSFVGDTLLREVTQPNQFEIQIEGDGHTIRRGSGAATTPADVIRVAATGGAEVFMIETRIELGPADTSAVRHDGQGSLRIWASEFGPAAGAGATGATAIVSGADVDEFNLYLSYIHGVAVGVEIVGDIYGIDNSTIASAGTDVVILTEPGLGAISNSTLAGPVGIEFDDGGVRVYSTTVLGDGASPRVGAQGAVIYRSSIVGSCSSPVLEPGDPGPGPGTVDLGYNVGGCFNPGQVIDTELAGNGCTGQPAVLGCVPTVALGSDSPARDAGDCSEVFDDQRGMQRTPQDIGCDAGSYELSQVERCDPGLVEVGTAAELNIAIRCLNETDHNDYVMTIALTHDITADELAGTAVFREIGGELNRGLTIEGNGHTIRRGPDAGTTPLPMFIARGDEIDRLEILDLAVELGENDTAALETSGYHTVEGERLVITALPGGTDQTGLIIGADHDQVFIRHSIIAGVDIGIETSADTFGLYASTVSSSMTDVRHESGSLVSIANSTLTGPVGLLGHDNSLLNIAYSTVVGDGAVFPDGEPGAVSAYSSIIGSCSAPVDERADPDVGVINNVDGTSVGGCFVPGQTMDTTLADNGCAVATPIGCPKTIALTEGAAAIGAGFCGDTPGGQVTVDQRGEPRTPLDEGCDAGSFESPGFDPSAELGDVDGDGDLDNADVQALLDYLAKGELPPALNAADYNDDGDIRLDDALLLAQHTSAAN